MNLRDDAIIELGLAGLLHNVGKLRILEAVLNKPGRLSDEEKEFVRQHPKAGLEMLKSNRPLPETILAVGLHHHELLADSGYPAGLQRADLTRPTRISAVCDVLDALTTQRPYKQAWPILTTLEWLYEQNERFDLCVVGRLHDAI